MLKGQIIKNISNLYTVLVADKTYDCIPRGKFRKENKTPIVGDYCQIDEQNNYIMELLPRKNELKRPSVCNIDYVLIVTSMKKPAYSSLLLDKEISLALLSKMKPVLYFSKIDLLNEEEKQEYQNIKKLYRNLHLPVYDNEHIKNLISFLKGSLVVLTGQTGAGKSTLLNKIDANLNILTGEISKALNRGKHTTRHTEIYFAKNIAFCDTPGFSSLDLKEYTKEEIRSSFMEFKKYSCKFQDCLHLKEFGCAVKEALEAGQIAKSRYQSYQKMLEESNNGNSRIILKKSSK